MRLTERDIRLLKDIALSQVLSRDQIIRLGYFCSVSRCNRRLTQLADAGLLRFLETPFFSQRLFSVHERAKSFLDDARIAQILTNRRASPMFLRHSLSVTESRIALVAKGAERWRFEVQVHHRFSHRGRSWEVRPDGMVWLSGSPLLIEVDLGHVALPKLAQKLRAYREYALCGAFERAYSAGNGRILVLTTGDRRKAHISRLAGDEGLFQVQTFRAEGIPLVGGWS